MATTTLNRKQLKAILPALKRGTWQPNTMPILSMVVLEPAQDSITFTVTDLEVTLSHRLDAKVDGFDGPIVVSLEGLSAFVRGSECEWIAIGVDGDNVVVHDDAMSCAIDSTPFDEFPLIPRAGSSILRDYRSFDAGILRDTLRFVSMASSSDTSRFNLNGVYYDADTDSKALECPRFVATDGHRLHLDVALSDGDYAIPSHIIPSGAVKAILSAIGTKKAVAGSVEWGEPTATETSAQYAVKVGRWAIAYRSIEGEYPNWRQVVPKESNGKVSLESDELAKACERQLKLNAVADTKNARVAGKLALLPDSDELTLEGATGSISRIRAHGSEFEPIGFNLRYLADGLAGFSGKLVTMGFGDELKPVLIESGIGRQAVVMPMRI